MYNDNGYTPNVPEDEEKNRFREAGYTTPDMNDRDYEKSSEPTSDESIPVDTTYHFSRQDDNIPYGSYVDDSPKRQTAYEPQPAKQESKSEDKQIRPNYQYSESNQSFSGDGGKKKSNKGLFVKVAAVAIVCSLVFGTAGGYLGSMLGGSHSEAVTDTAAWASGDVMTDTSQDESAVSSPNITNTSAETGGTLTNAEIYELATNQVVSITSDGTTTYYGQTTASEAMGTGFVISEDGYIVTNYHVISNSVSSGGSITVDFKNGDTYAAELVGGYEAGDVALLKIEATGLSAVTLGDSNNITVGESICVVGNALGEYDYTLTGGFVSGLDRLMTFTSDTTGATETINMFQIDAAVNSGNSGGPVYNSRGEVIGIVTSKISSSYSSSSASVEGLGFAIPINDALSIVDDIQTKGYVEGSVLLNVEVQTVSSSVIDSYGIPSGVNVTVVNSGGAAEAAGVEAKDIITKIDDTDITSVSDLKQALKNYSVGDTATLTVYRSGGYLELTVTFTQTENTDTSVNSQAEDSQNSQGYPDGYGNSDGYGSSDPFGGMFG